MLRSIFLMFLFTPVLLAALPTLRIGVLAFGTVNWEMSLIKGEGLDKKHGFLLEVTPYASKKGVAVAYQAGNVDMIINDWIWANRQNVRNARTYFYPFSKATGGLYTHDAAIRTLRDLQGKKLGVAGGALDKTWLLFRAYARQHYGIDLMDYCDVVFAAPPILNLKLQQRELDAVLNFWHYNARLQAMGYHSVMTLTELLQQMKLQGDDVPFIGWVFDGDFGDAHPSLVNAFFQASYEAKQKLKSDPEAWKGIRQKMRAPGEAVYASLKGGYIAGIPTRLDDAGIARIQKLYGVLLKEAGPSLLGRTTTIDAALFWRYAPETE